MWKRPWKMVEGFAVGAGLVLVGLLLQFSAGPIAWNNLSFFSSCLNLFYILFFWK